MQIFLDDHDYTRFLGVLGDVVEEFSGECWNFCLMPNHYHCTLRPTLPNFSEAIRALNSRYAQRWNRRHAAWGTSSKGRFKDQIVGTDNYLLVLCRYIARNPVRAGLTAGPDAWRWSSYAATVGLQALPPFLTSGPLLAVFGTELDASRWRFAEYVGGDRTDAAAEDRIRSSASIVGDQAFMEKVMSCAAPSGAKDVINRSLAHDRGASA